MKQRHVLGAALIAVTAFLFGCSAFATSVPQPTATPTPDIPATVDAVVNLRLSNVATVTPAPTPDINATIEAGIKAAVAAIPTPTTIPTLIPTVAPTITPTPTAIPTLQSMLAITRPSVVRVETDIFSGSGFIFQMGFPTAGQGNTALVMTNYHVIENGSWVKVTVNDSKTFNGEVLGIDPINDLAVLKICCDQLKALSIANASEASDGAKAIAFGYPLGIEGRASISEGIVSATRYQYGQWVIQTDAAINPGNSGGPLLSLSGAVLGVNTYRTESSTDGRDVQGIGFAVSQKTLQQRIPDLISGSLRTVPTPIPTPTPAQLSHVLEGQRLFGLGFYDSAIAEFTLAIEIDREYAVAYHWRATSYSRLGNHQKALTDINQALLRDPTNLDLYRWRGFSHYELGIFGQAIDDYNRVISQHPTPSVVDYTTRGYALFETEDYWRAINDFTEVIRVQPSAVMYLFRGVSYYHTAADVLTNQYWKAISDFDQAILMEPTGDLYGWRGSTYYKLGLNTLSRADWNTACILDGTLC